jgi:hypothetical protein
LRVELENNNDVRCTFEDNHVTIYNLDTEDKQNFSIKRSQSILTKEEKIEYLDYKKQKKVKNALALYTKDKDGYEKKITEINNVKSYNLQPTEYEVEYYSMGKAPTGIEDISGKVAKEIIRLKPESFVLYLEITNLNRDYLISKISMENNILSFLDIVPSLWGKIYSKKDRENKQNAIEDLKKHLSNKTKFYKVRYSFAVRKKKIAKNFSVRLMQSLAGVDLAGCEKIDTNVRGLLYPWANTAFVNESDFSFEMATNDIVDLFDFRTSNTDLSGFNKFDLKDLKAVKNTASFYMATEDDLFGIDFFSGPEMFNVIIIAPSGSGKSFFGTNNIDGFIHANKDSIVWILDRGGSYSNFVETNENSVNLNLKKSSTVNCINPFTYNFDYAVFIFIETVENDYNSFRKELEYKGTKNIPSLKDFIDNENRYNMLVKSIELLNYMSTFVVEKDGSRVHKGDELDILYFANPEEEDSLFRTHFVRTDPHVTLAVYDNILGDMLRVKKADDDKKRASYVEKEIEPVISALIIKGLEEQFADITGEITSESSISEIEEVLSTGMYITIKDIATKLEENLSKLIDDSFSKGDILEWINTLDVFINRKKSGKLFNGKPNINFEAKLLNIDFGEIDDENVEPILLSSILMNFYKLMTEVKNKGIKKKLFVDESHKILNSNDESALASIAYLFRTTRKWNSAVVLLSQLISDLIKRGEEATGTKLSHFKALEENSGWKILMGEGHNEEELKRLGINKYLIDIFQREEDPNKEKDRRFLIQTKNSKLFGRLIVSDVDYWTATTNANEKALVQCVSFVYGGDKVRAIIKLAEIFKMSFISTYKEISILIMRMDADKTKLGNFEEVLTELGATELDMLKFMTEKQKVLLYAVSKLMETKGITYRI